MLIRVLHIPDFEYSEHYFQHKNQIAFIVIVEYCVSD